MKRVTNSNLEKKGCNTRGRMSEDLISETLTLLFRSSSLIFRNCPSWPSFFSGVIGREVLSVVFTRYYYYYYYYDVHIIYFDTENHILDGVNSLLSRFNQRR